jgi:hypothetical protein
MSSAQPHRRKDTETPPQASSFRAALRMKFEMLDRIN